VVDIYTGGNHAFAKTRGTRKTKGHKEGIDLSKIEEIHTWGLNNYGQLGIGNKENTMHPTRVEIFCGLSEEDSVLDIKGGTHHSICLLKNGTVYGWGRNDDGQAGLPKDYQEEEPAPPKEGEGMLEEGKDAESVTRPSTQVEKQKNEYLSPVKVPGLANIAKIYSSSHFCYALSKENNVYSWGEGTSYVCLNGKDDSIYGPFKVSEKILAFEQIRDIGLGSSHVAILSGPPEVPTPVLNESVREKLKASVFRKMGGKIPINIMNASPISVNFDFSYCHIASISMKTVPNFPTQEISYANGSGK
jgi:alpha-tubulin suppressor-like RCC1 family protein